MITRRVVLIQLPIPPLGPAPIRGNVPLAPAYLKLFAEQQGLNRTYDIEIFPAHEANTLGDLGLVRAIAAREPSMVGFTCYVWNIERTLWICHRLKRLRPDLKIVLGGPEITPDNQWVLDSPDYDYAVIGEGEQTFAALLEFLLERPNSRRTLPMLGGAIPGLYIHPDVGPRYDPRRRPPFREPLPDINVLGSPYLSGILDAADERMMLLETTRGCIFKCKFCYYPKSYDKQYYLSFDRVRASLDHAGERGATEVFLLDPTLNQRKDFPELLKVLAEGNPDRQFSYFGELRGEGVTEKTARFLKDANFTEVEVGLQSIDPDAMDLMDRKNNLRAFERGVRAMMAEGIRVKVDLIVGLPGDTVESVRRGMHYLRDGNLFNDVQVFNLAILPGTAFREEAASLGLRFQPRPPYYVMQTPTLARTDLFGLMHEAQAIFDVEFDAQPPPMLKGLHSNGIWYVDLDHRTDPSPPSHHRQALTVWFSGTNLDAELDRAVSCVRRILVDNPFTTLQIVLEPTSSSLVSVSLLEALTLACHEHPTYLDKYYSLQPGARNGAKRLVVTLPPERHEMISPDWRNEITELTTLVCSEESTSGFTITQAARGRFG